MVDASAPGGTIDFAPDVRGTITLSLGEILIDKSLTITGPGAAVLTLCSSDAVPGRIFQVDSSLTHAASAVAISGLRLAGCRYDAGRGAIYAYQDPGQTLTLSRMTFQNNTASGGDGGAVHVQGNGSLLVSASTFEGNTSSGDGGAIRNESPASSSISGSVFRRNTSNNGGAIALGSAPSAETTTIVDSSFDRNRAGWGGALYLGSDAPPVRVSTSTFTGNTGTNYGGAVSHSASEPLTVESTQFIDNESDDGAGIYSEAAADLNLTDTLFEGNIATSSGGSAFTREPNPPSYAGTDTVTRSVFRRNTSRHWNGVIQYAYSAVGLSMTDSALVENTGGDGLGAAGLYWGGDALTIANTTFARNEGLTSIGSTLYLNGGPTSLDSVTIAGNTNSGATSGIYQAVVSPTQIRNSIIAGNRSDSGTRGDCSGGTITFTGGAGTSVLGDGTGCTVTGEAPRSGDAGLDALRPSTTTSGDQTWIVPLSPGSPAIDAGATSLTTDQRGVARPQGPAPDIGAVEMRPAALGVALRAGQDRVALGAKADLYAVARNTGDFTAPAATLSFGLPPAFLTFAPPGDGAACAASTTGAVCDLGALPGEEERPVAVSATTAAAGSTTATATLAGAALPSASASVPLTILGAGPAAARPAVGICSRQIVRVRTRVNDKRTTRPLARVSCRLTLNEPGIYAFRFSKGKGNGNWAILRGSTIAGAKTRRTRTTVKITNVKVGRKLFVSALMATKARSVPLTVSFTSSTGQVTPQTIK